MNLSKNDYLKILNYYNIDHNKKNLKLEAEKILANKLCKCINRINNDSKDEKKAIAVCSSIILKKRNLKIAKFTCKNGAKLLSTKKLQNKLYKTKKTITLKKKK